MHLKELLSWFGGLLLASPLAFAQAQPSQTFTFQGNVFQSYTVPESGWYLLDASGAQGGSASNGSHIGGYGARMQGVVELQAGDVLRVAVGGQGGTGTGDGNNVSGGGGGGASSVVRIVNGTQDVPSGADELLLVAGGGGGGAADDSGSPGLTTGSARSEAFPNGGMEGQGGSVANDDFYGGAGGAGYNGNGGSHHDGNATAPLLSRGGTAYLNGNQGGSGGGNGGNGGWGGGGEGGPAKSSLFSNHDGGGGGGGGYSGGAGGPKEKNGGGGGGSFVAPRVDTTLMIATRGARAGNGVVSLQQVNGPVTYIPLANQSVRLGEPVTLGPVLENPVGDVSYQWLKDGVVQAGETGPTLTLDAFRFTDSGAYQGVATRTDGGNAVTVISLPATLSVASAVPAAQLVGWGNNGNGQLGIGTSDEDPHPIPTLVTSDVVAVSAGAAEGGGTATGHSLLVKSDGTLWAMGRNSFGQLGLGTSDFDPHPIPTLVTSDVVAVAAGEVHSLFVKRDGTLWAMGNGGNGRLGLGDTKDRNVPTQVTSDVVAVSAGSYHSLLVKSDGTLWAMGDNDKGQLGLGDTDNRNVYVPTQVTSDVVAVSAGENHSLFVKSDGTLWAMGHNYYGQLGLGDTKDRNVPTLVTSDVAAAAGAWHSLFVKRDGTLWGMGYNHDGQLGIGNTTLPYSPVQVPGVSDVVAVSAGSYHSLLVKSDGTLWAMGDNRVGQLGDGFTTDQYSPEQVFWRDANNYPTSPLIVASLATMSSADHSPVIAQTPSLTAVPTPVQVTLGAFLQTYDGGPHPVAVATDPAGLDVLVTYDGDPTPPVNAGTYAVQATVTGFGYAGATSELLVIERAPQVISVAPISVSLPLNRVLGSLEVKATSSSGGAVTLTLDPGSAATLTGSTLSGFGASGTITLRANQAGDSNHLPAPEVVLTLNVSKDNQWVNFGALPERVATDGPILLSATASSGLAVEFAVVSGPASVSGSTLTLTGSGVVTVQATQSGDERYNAATPVNRSFTVSKATQSITFEPLPDVTVTNGPITLSATATSGLPVAFTRVSGPATLSGDVLTVTGYGTVTVQASQVGDGVYEAASPVDQAFTVTRAPQSITFRPLRTVLLVGDGPILLSATASSGLPLNFESSDESVLVIDGDEAYAVGPGTATITAVQGGSPVWQEASWSQAVTVVEPSALAIHVDETGSLVLTVTGSAGMSYAIESTGDMEQGEWQTLEVITLSTDSQEVILPVSGTLQFYRVRLQQGGLGGGLNAVEGQDYFNSQPVLLKWIQPGTFQMGSIAGTDPDRYDSEVQHTVTLTRGFWLSDHEVTQAEYQAVMGNNPSYFTGDSNRPVEYVSWFAAVAYCETLTDRERAAGRITAQQAYRLPTEAEWEYAARAGTTGARYTVNGYDVAESLDYIAWYHDNSRGEGFLAARETHPVKTKAPNAWGLYDMIGNVWEWCADWYGDYPSGSVTDPTGPLTGSHRVKRGGDFDGVPRDCRSAERYGLIPDFISRGGGFRPALSSVR